MTDCAHGRYRLIEKIGQGGTGTVYLAYDRKLAIERVIKEVRFAGAPDYERNRQQLVSEINIIKELQHPFIPQIIDLFSEGDALMIVMEKIEGKNLKTYIRDQGCVSRATALDWGIQLARILVYLHGKDPPVYHRDLKPENVILHPSGRLYLIDFGIAGHREVCSGGNEFSGTLGYAAPEQYLDSLMTDGRGDIYSLGRLLSYCLFGNPAEVGKFSDSGKEMQKKADDFRKILRKCTEADPEKRYENMSKVLEDLVRLSNSKRRAGNRILRYCLWISAGIMCLTMAGQCLGRAARGREAGRLLDCAMETPDREKKRVFYQESLKKAPWKEAIYQNMLDTYILPNHFSSGEAVVLMNILQDADALPVLKRQNPKAYARFCYDLGIGYFFQMGGGVGKMESEIWFQRAENTGKGLTKSQSGRAACYRKIGRYYRSFLYYGQDRNREGDREDYLDFFETLRQLTTYSLKHPGKEDQSAAWYAAYEVAVEIRDYAGDFLKEDEITEDTLRKELGKIETFLKRLPDDMDKDKKHQLMQIVDEAKKRVQIMEANGEKQINKEELAASSDHFSDAGADSEGRDEY